MKISDSDLKVNQNIYPDVVSCDRMHLVDVVSHVTASGYIFRLTFGSLSDIFIL